MKRFTVLATLALGVAGTAVVAQDAQGWYLRGDLGVTMVQATEVQRFLEPGLGPTPDADVEFDPGMQLGVGGGYQLRPWLAVEVESGFLFNSISSVGGDSVDAALLQVPFLGNVVIQCSNFGRLKPFVGVGAGGLATSLMIGSETFDLGDGSTLTLDGTDTEVVFAYQAFGGLRYEFEDRWSLGLTYRFLGSSAPTWEIESDFGTPGSGDIAIDNVFTHSLSVGFQMRL